MTAELPIARQLAEWALSLDLGSVDEAVIMAARRHLIDGVGCAIAAYRHGTADSAVRAAIAGGGVAGKASIIGREDRTSPAAAALANGTLVHALDFDDSHARGLVHPTAPILATALAVGEARGLAGRDVLTAAIAGYETICRLAAAAPHGFHRRGFHATGVCGALAAALVASRLNGLDAEQATSAVGIAGSMASGSLEFLTTGSTTKQLHPGWAAHCGVWAAALAAAGADGPETIVEGDRGLYRLYTDSDTDSLAVVAGLGSVWEMTQIGMKPYPCCQLSHAPMDAIEQVLSKIDSPGKVETITAWVPEDSVGIVCEPSEKKSDPTSSYDAKFSLAWCVAALVVDGGVTIETFAGFGREDVRNLASRFSYVSVEHDSPAADMPGRVEVRLTGGNVLVAEVASSRGTSARPMSDDDVLQKFCSNAGSSEARSLADRIMHLDDEASVATLMSDVNAGVAQWT